MSEELSGGHTPPHGVKFQHIQNRLQIARWRIDTTVYLLSEGVFSMNKLLFFIMLVVAVTGCSSRKDFYATGGSRADGSIDMAYDFKQFETPIVDINQAKKIANDKCAVWGYERAEAFGGKIVSCEARNGFGDCVAGQTIIKYQCIGNITPSNQAIVSKLPAAMLTPAQYKEMRVKALMDQNLPYSEYQKKYQAIMAE
ncbi:YecR family lipoprotein [Pseudomonas helleri]|uniref:YecR family lipoprotein n=1 Tax=Pseudomonas helleri TaxID=1608996 RepID=UPI001E5D901F|nr:YecR family lipoprotein [Pseudomonas helleri]